MPSALPIPAAGYSTLLSIPLFLIGFRILLGRDTLWLPERLRRRPFDPKSFSRKLVSGMLRLIRDFARAQLALDPDLQRDAELAHARHFTAELERRARARRWDVRTDADALRANPTAAGQTLLKREADLPALDRTRIAELHKSPSGDPAIVYVTVTKCVDK